MVNLPGQLIDQVSLVIPVHNRLGMLERALLSALEQTLKPLEIIVIDDGSTEPGITKLCNSYPSVRLISQENHGVSHARNRGIKEAQGQWIAFLDSDDTWHPQKLEEQNNFLSKQKNVLFIHSDEEWIRNGKNVNPPVYLDKSNKDIFSRSLTRCLIGASSVVIHQSIFHTVGLFDEHLPVCEDYDLWLRILIDFPVGHIPNQLITKYGGHSDQLSTRFWGMDRFRVKSLEKLLQHANLTPIQKKSILETLVQKLGVLSVSYSKHGKEKEAGHFFQKKEVHRTQLEYISKILPIAS